MTQWDRVRSTFERVHADLFAGSRYEAEFFNYSGGSWNPDTDTFDNESRDTIGTKTVEIVPPAIDSTVNAEGTSFDWNTSIRLPNFAGGLTVTNNETVTIASGEVDEFDTVTIESGGTLTVNGKLVVYDDLTVNGTLNGPGQVNVLDTGSFTGALIPLGEDNDRPTEVEVTDQVDAEIETYELHGFNNELGSGFVMCRLVEK